MLRTVLQVTGIARALGDLRFQLETRAERAVDQVKGVAVRIAVAAALALAAVIFSLLGLIVGLIILYLYLEPQYGPATSLAIVGGTLVAVAIVCVLAAALTGRGNKKRKDVEAVVETDHPRSLPRSQITSPREIREAETLDTLVSLASIARRRDRRAPAESKPVDAVSLMQEGDRRTVFVVLGAVAAIGWLMGRTMPRPARR